MKQGFEWRPLGMTLLPGNGHGDAMGRAFPSHSAALEAALANGWEDDDEVLVDSVPHETQERNDIK